MAQVSCWLACQPSPTRLPGEQQKPGHRTLLSRRPTAQSQTGNTHWLLGRHRPDSRVGSTSSDASQEEEGILAELCPQRGTVSRRGACHRHRDQNHPSQCSTSDPSAQPSGTQPSGPTPSRQTKEHKKTASKAGVPEPQTHKGQHMRAIARRPVPQALCTPWSSSICCSSCATVLHCHQQLACLF